MTDLNFKETTIVTINDQITKDPIVYKVMEKIFEWANEMGLKGKKAKNFEVEEDCGIFKSKIKLKCQLQKNNQFYGTCEHGRSCIICPDNRLQKAIKLMNEAAEILEDVHDCFDGICVKSIYASCGETEARLKKVNNDNI